MLQSTTCQRDSSKNFTLITLLPLQQKEQKPLKKEMVWQLLIKVFSALYQEMAQNHDITPWAKHEA